MNERPGSKIKFVLPDGAVFEAEGSPEFIAAERREFLLLIGEGGGGTETAHPPSVEPDWESLLNSDSKTLSLRGKLRAEAGETDACLILLAAARTLHKEKKPTASQLARWLRSSGYPVGRIDRALQPLLERGELLASGSRRARRYELSGPGLSKAFRLGREQAKLLNPAP